MAKTFDIGDLVRYDSAIPMYLPQAWSGIGIVTALGAVDIKLYSMTAKTEVIVKPGSCTLLSSAKANEDT